tara:strand:- start:91 stop:546 length:456 start_codon:yes stop_codon:yes gene_type:complete
MLTDMFRTKRGTYHLDTNTGLFTIKGKVSTPKRFLGSIDPSIKVNISKCSSMVLDQIRPEYRANVLLHNIGQGYTQGFTPEFIVGYRPLGLVCEPTDIHLVGENELLLEPEFKGRLEQSDRSIKIELGLKIEEVYRQLEDNERGYKICLDL